ncbi:response regulator [Candidatus Gracilibacteria bacterium]|nr:response regulator [Candidatus Gracilibacteria bacterium]MCF7856104.1 response regulator [Candidatus Gracilibacteria bacterium]MCF7896523.1 response regulator [Candidatus Gracilibacteria bacterium]
MSDLEACSNANQRILIVDDETPISELLKRVLTKEGYKVTTKNNPVEVLKLFESDSTAFDFDLLISDLKMPEISGVDLAAAIRKIRDEIPVVFMTGFSDETEKIAEFPNAVLIEKPFKLSDLKNTVYQFLGQNSNGATTKSKAG